MWLHARFVRGSAGISVFDVSRLSRDSCSKLLRSDIRNIKQLTPKSIKLTKQQAIQVVLTHQETSKIRTEAVRRELESLTYSLDFLDYETFNFAVPPLSRFRSYQQFVFQYSLHVQRSPGEPLEHRNSELGVLRPEYERFSEISIVASTTWRTSSRTVSISTIDSAVAAQSKLLPVLCPEFSYKSLSVQNGAQAMEVWHKLGLEE